MRNIRKESAHFLLEWSIERRVDTGYVLLVTYFHKCFLLFQRVSVFVSVLTLMSISVERYLAICHPLQHHGNFFKTRIIIFTIWLVSLIIPSPDFYNMVLIHHPEIPESLRPWLTYCRAKDEQMEQNFQIFLIIVMYLIPLIVMSITYVKIARCLWSSASTRNAVSQSKLSSLLSYVSY